ncbi:MAG: VIT family protein [Sulfitobacter sp.]|nr:VIT family protein [Sulfitobacter sp.]MDE0985048.1 VIT family protein [Yoonia sp.]MDE1131525.1 VIT family protein [Ascidiaceihabitans sp.]
MNTRHTEHHNMSRIGWLRAAVLGANDGIVSTASIIVGVAAAVPGTEEVLLAGTAGLVAGAMSMAAGEYVSVSSQSDTEAADLAKERQELIDQPEEELEELAATFIKRGVEGKTALEVAKQLTLHDALGAHAREELGITDTSTARPLQAAVTSAMTFAIGAAPPLLIVLIAPPDQIGLIVSVATLGFLAILGSLGALAGGAGIIRGATRVTLWGAAAMAATAVVGSLFHVVV